MKILYTTDLHGDIKKYRQVLDTAKRHQAEIIINGGDMLPNRGYLPQKKFINNYLNQYFEEVAESNIIYLCILGNDDLRIIDDVFNEVCDQHRQTMNIAGQITTIKGFSFIGFNLVTDYPFRLKDRVRRDSDDFVFPRQFGSPLLSCLNGKDSAYYDELSDWFNYAIGIPTIATELNSLPTPEDYQKTVYIIHNPPRLDGLDRTSKGFNIGSKAVTNFITERQPLLSLHGHIHESHRSTGEWKACAGTTICIQPGQLRQLTYVLINLETLQMTRYEE